jgi:hypothetical protein
MSVEIAPLPLPIGTVPCRNCGLPISASDPLTGSWSAKGGVLVSASHLYRNGCTKAMGARIAALEEQVEALGRSRS